MQFSWFRDKNSHFKVCSFVCQFMFFFFFFYFRSVFLVQRLEYSLVSYLSFFLFDVSVPLSICQIWFLFILSPTLTTVWRTVVIFFLLKMQSSWFRDKNSHLKVLLLRLSVIILLFSNFLSSFGLSVLCLLVRSGFCFFYFLTWATVWRTVVLLSLLKVWFSWFRDKNPHLKVFFLVFI